MGYKALVDANITLAFNLIKDLAEDYSYTVIGVPNKKFVWIMSRKSKIPDQTYSVILENLKSIGYDTSKIVKMPQNWE